MVKKNRNFTELEIRIMRVLWESEENLTIREIGQQLAGEGISRASVAQSIKFLMEKKAVAVGEHVQVANVYARTFYPCYSQEEFLALEFEQLQKSVLGTRKVSLKGFAAALLNSGADKMFTKEEQEALQQVIEKGKKELTREE